MSMVVPAGGWMPRQRAAVSAIFLLDGFVIGNWAARVPELKARLGLDEAALGLLILCFGAGALAFMPVVGAVIARDGSRRILRLLAPGLAAALLMVTLAPSVPAAAALFVFGALQSGTDVAMNANAVAVERGMRRAIMSSCHAWWSVGGLIGATTGGVLLARLGPLGHAALVLACGLALVAAAAPALLRDQPRAGAARVPLRLPRELLPWLIGLIALSAMVSEGAIRDWAALYMRSDLGASVEASGLAYGAFSAAMALMRFSGDPVRDRLGAVRTLGLSAAVAGAGLLLAGLAPGPGLAAAGFALAGVGIANVVPIAFSAAGNLPGLPPGIGLSMVTFIGYSSILIAPPLIGVVAARTGLATVFVAAAALFLPVLALSRLATHADLAAAPE
jgi:predicted MFS family arabinose efflux permease